MEKPQYLCVIMIEVCQMCGKGLSGRIDKKFCSDACRSEYHNRRRRREARITLPVNRILSKNRRILIRTIQIGKKVEKYSVLAGKGFNFSVYTSRVKRFIKPDIYQCYDYTYYVTVSGKVHITPPDLLSH